MQIGGFWADCSYCPRIALPFLFIPNPDEGLNFLLFPCLLVRLPALLSLKKEDVMKKSGLFIFLVLWLSCPLLAQEKTYDPIFDDPVFMDPGFDLGQVASGSLNYQRYGPNGYGSEAKRVLGSQTACIKIFELPTLWAIRLRLGSRRVLASELRELSLGTVRDHSDMGPNPKVIDMYTAPLTWPRFLCQVLS